jgi:Protein of unknown function (DUF2934)
MTATLEQQIRQRAYRLFEERGCKDGHAVEDWLRAEREIRSFASRTGRMEADPGQSDASQSRTLNQDKSTSLDGRSIRHYFESFEIDGAPPREITRH